MAGSIRVLHVDDDPAVVELVARYLERERDDLCVRTETDPTAVLDRLDAEPVDCVVSDYQMPDVDGLALLELVRDTYPEMPFILFTGRGSEDVASRAISAGVTDYLQKGGTETYELLANRVAKAVDRYRAHREAERLQAGYRRLAEAVDDPIVSVDQAGTVVYANSSVERVVGYPPEELEGQPVSKYVGDSTVLADGDGVERCPLAAESDDAPEADWRSLRTRCRHADGHEVPVDVAFTAIDFGDERVYSGIVRECENSEA